MAKKRGRKSKYETLNIAKQLDRVKMWRMEGYTEELKKKFNKLLKKSGFEILGFIDHFFCEQGYTVL